MGNVDRKNFDILALDVHYFLKFGVGFSDVWIEWERPMVITDFRVQSILRTYTRQLQRSKAGKVSPESGDQKPNVEKVSISDEGRRRLMMERLTNQVFEKMYSKQENGTETAGNDTQLETPAGQERE